jgi:hypothetical protein
MYALFSLETGDKATYNKHTIPQLTTCNIQLITLNKNYLLPGMFLLVFHSSLCSSDSCKLAPNVSSKTVCTSNGTNKFCKY